MTKPVNIREIALGVLMEITEIGRASCTFIVGALYCLEYNSPNTLLYKIE